MDPRELGFTPRRPVPWLAPLLLISTGLRTLLAMLFGAYLDKRELQNAFGDGTFRQVGPDGGLWLDYVADLGDGFDATYSVAYLLAQPELTVDGHRLPRAQTLVMGGDQVYPAAGYEAYEDRCKGPYQAALPVAPPEQPTLFAVPGNHDWYDGLTAFLRLFVRTRDRHFGGWGTGQSRSYFAVELPAGWWLLGLDDQSGSYLDDPQLTYFDEVARKLTPESKVILAVPAPTWVKAVDHPNAYDSIDYFIRTLVAPTGAQVRVLVSGDLHHYARYAGADRQLITCGGGGAYLYPTHRLPEKLEVPPRDTLTRRASNTQEYDLAARYPDKARSRRYGWGDLRPAAVPQPGLHHAARHPAHAADAGHGRRGGAAGGHHRAAAVQRAAGDHAGGGDDGRGVLRQAADGGRETARPALDPRGGARAGPGGARRRRHVGLVAAAVLRLAVAAAGGRRGGALRAGERSGRQPARRALPAGGRRVRGQPERVVRRPGHRGLEGVPAVPDRPGRHADDLPDRRGQGVPRLAAQPRPVPHAPPG